MKANLEYIAGIELFKIYNLIKFSLFLSPLYQSSSHLIIDFIFAKFEKNFSILFFSNEVSKIGYFLVEFSFKLLFIIVNKE